MALWLAQADYGLRSELNGPVTRDNIEMFEALWDDLCVWNALYYKNLLSLKYNKIPKNNNLGHSA